MKDFGKSHSLSKWLTSHHQIFLAMKFTMLLLTIALLHVHGGVFSQNVTLSARNLPLKKVFHEIEKQTGYIFFCNTTLLEMARPVNINVKDAPLPEVLERCFSDEPLSYYIQNKTVFVTEKIADPRRPKNDPGHGVTDAEIPAANPIKGKITDEQGEPLAGVTITVKGTKISTVSNADGSFSLDAPADAKDLVVSFVGMQNQ